MNRKTLFIIFLLKVSLIYSDIPRDDFVIIDTCNQNRIKLGDKLSVVFGYYNDITIKGEQIFSNIEYIEYESSGITFSISKRAAVAKNAHILRIVMLNNRYITKRNISIGNSKDDVIKAYNMPDDIFEGDFIYINAEYDHMELIFSFNASGIVDQIELVVGT